MSLAAGPVEASLYGGIDLADPYGLPLLKAIFWQTGQTDN